MTKTNNGHKEQTQYIQIEIKYRPAKVVSATSDWLLKILILINSILVFAPQFLAKNKNTTRKYTRPT